MADPRTTPIAGARADLVVMDDVAPPRCGRCHGPLRQSRDLAVWICPQPGCVAALHAGLTAAAAGDREVVRA